MKFNIYEKKAEIFNNILELYKETKTNCNILSNKTWLPYNTISLIIKQENDWRLETLTKILKALTKLKNEK